jgi:thiol-disulfide isomerase/thioredoxin
MRAGPVLALALLLALPIGGRAVEPGASEPVRLGEFVPVSPPQPAPHISFGDLAGNTVDLSEFKGKLVLVNLWATWCEPCLREMPSLERMQSQLGDKIAVAAISEDRGGGKIVGPFVAKLGLKFVTAYLDPKSTVGRAFSVQGLPTSILIDRSGRVVGRVAGAAEWDSAEMLEILKSFLSDNGALKAALPAPL